MFSVTKRHMKDTPAKNLRLNINFKNVNTDEEEQDDLNVVFELVEETEIVDEAQTHIESTNLDEASCDKLINLPSPKFSALRIGIKSMCIEQMTLLEENKP